MAQNRRPDPGETEGQAQTWEKVKNKARRYGMCRACAALYAWGIQGGFSSVRPPCPDCAPLVAVLPRERANGWRSVAGSAHALRSWMGMAGQVGRNAPADAPVPMDAQCVGRGMDYDADSGVARPSGAQTTPSARHRETTGEREGAQS